MGGEQEIMEASPSPQSSGSREDLSVKEEDRRSGSGSDHSANEQMAASKARDPDRPKRKKARHACSNCQRAHITCSDNRPCERCVSRNIGDQCRDGIRKRAKYLHDAPPEALISSHGAAAAYGHLNGFQHVHSARHHPNIDIGQPNSFVPAPAGPSPQGYHQYHHNGNGHTQDMAPPQIETQSIPMVPSRTSPASSAFNSAHPSPMQQVSSMSTTMSGQTQQGSPHYAEPNDANLYNFDLTGMNYGNHYGALEFGMLAHMASDSQQTGMLPSSQQPATNTYGQAAYSNTQYPGQPFAMNLNGAWATSQGPSIQQMQNSYGPGFNSLPYRRASQTMPHAIAIGNSGNGSSVSGASSASSGEVPSTGETEVPVKRHDQNARVDDRQHAPRKDQGATKSTKKRSPKLSQSKPQSPPRPDPASIYSSVVKPYPYTESFHRLFERMTQRFTKKKLAQIAKAMETIRPSFISTTSSLVLEDLIFMEKNFQRSLLEYQGSLDKLGTPTIVCRRSGEIAQTTQAFQTMTGWTSDVLLGKEQNLNTNVNAARSQGASTNASNVPSATGKGGYNTPNMPRTPAEPFDGVKSVEEQQKHKRHHPVFLAELLDEESVVKFYEDFAQLAFADTKGSVQQPCKLLRYVPPGDNSQTDAKSRNKKKKNSIKMEDSTKKVEGEEGMKRLGGDDGKVSCMYCWSIKRDVFNIPSIIVINFLPILF